MTTVKDGQVAAQWDRYFQTYRTDDIQAIPSSDHTSFYVDFTELQTTDPELADYVLARPAHSIRVGAASLKQLLPPDCPSRPHLRVRGLPKDITLHPRRVRSDHLGKFVAVEGMVRRAGEVRPMIQEAAYECKFCANIEHVLQEDELLQEPVACSNCEKTGPWRLREEESRFVDHQVMVIQESPDVLRGGEQPEDLHVFLRDDAVQTLSPGQRARINGIIMTLARRRGASSVKQTDFNKVLMTISAEILDEQFQDLHVSEQDKERFNEWVKDKGFVKQLRDSIAPSIAAMDLEKEAIVYSLVSAPRFEDNNGDYRRGDIHTLIVGDPGVAKSKLLGFIPEIAPRLVHFVATGASSTGLGGGVETDEVERRRYIEAGALVRADGGVLTIDELDKLPPEQRGPLYSGMEQQFVSIMKIVKGNLPCRCAVIAAANPREVRFDEYEAPGAQINLDPALLSRFDLVICNQDKPNRERDARVATAILGESQPGLLNTHDIRKFIAHAKTFTPVMEKEATDHLAEYWLDLRNRGDGSPVTPRHLDGLRRLTLASARIHLREAACLEDAENARILMEACMMTTGAIRRDGSLDADIVSMGASKDQHATYHEVLGIVRDLTRSNNRGFAMEEDVLREARAKNLDADAVRKGLKTMLRNNQLYTKGGAGTYALL